MIEMVALAEAYIRRARRRPEPPRRPTSSVYSSAEIAGLRREISEVAGAPMILQVDDGPDALAFANRADVAAISQQGPATPDHVIRTKRLPMLGRDVATYAREYERYFAEHAGRSSSPVADARCRTTRRHRPADGSGRRRADPRPTRPSPRTSTGTPSRSSSTPPNSVATAPSRPRTSSTSSIGTWSKPSSARERRRRSPARSLW